jgi:transketolase
MKPYKPHDSQRGYFAFSLYELMEKNENIWVITADLGYGMFDTIYCDFGNRFINVGASEQTALDISVGLALSNKIPVVYTITPFFSRGYETIRNYINRENLPVKLIGSGRDDDYKRDGFSHNASDIEEILSPFKSIVEYYPATKDRVKMLLPDIMFNGKPTFLSLKR